MGQGAYAAHLRLRPSLARSGLWAASVSVLYFLAARLGLSLSQSPEGIAPVWLPGGLFLAAILLTPRRRRPLLIGVLGLTDLAAELLAGTALPLSLAYALALTLDAALGSWLLGRFAGEPVDFGRPRHVVGLLAFAVVLSNVTAGILAATAAFVVLGAAFLPSLVSWVVPDAIGTLVLTPFLLSFASLARRAGRRVDARKAAEGAGLLIVLALLTVVALSVVADSGPRSLLLLYGTFPLLLWAGLRLGIRGVASALMTLTAITVVYAGLERLPHLYFYGYELQAATVVQLYLAVLAIPSLFLGASVTEHGRTTELIRASAARLAKAEEIAHVGSWEFDPGSGGLYWSDEVFRIFGLEPRSFHPGYQSFLESVHPEDRAAVDAAYQDSLAAGREGYEIAHRVVRRSTGEVRHVHEKCEHQRDASGRVVRSRGMVHDLTEHKQAERALLELRRKDDEALRVARMGHWEFDVASGMFTFNDRYYDLHGITAEQAGGYQMSAEAFARRYVHPAYAYQVEEAIGRAIGSDAPAYQVEFESCILRGDGEPRTVTVWFRSEKDARGTTTKLYGVNQDVTERRRAEEAIRERDRYIETVLENSPIGFAVNTIHDGRGVFVSGRFEDIYGVPRGSIRTVEEYFETVYRDPAFRQQIKARITGDMASGEAARMRWEDIPITTASGEKRFVTAINIPLLDQNLMVSTVQDVTARHRAEAALLDSETRFQTLVDQAGFGFALLDETGRFADVNDAQCRQLGYSRDELLRLRLFDVDPQLGPEEYQVKFREQAGRPPWTSESLHRRKDGTTFPVEVTTSVVGIGDTLRALMVVRDITERRRAEQERQRLQAQLVEAQKMETVGRLAGGVAHDFNNMLAVILANVELMLADSRLAPSSKEGVIEIQQAAQRSAELTRQLLAFARRQAIEPVALNLNDATEGMLKMLRRVIGEDVEIRWLPGASLWTVQMDPAQVGQILVNLCVNARDAITGVGTVTIETRNVAFDGGAGVPPGCLPGEYVQVTVSDSGAGMGPEVIDHLFEPFFTTKQMGRGTGLGLATVYGIVRQNNGFINVYSEPGHGTTFKVYLPRLQGEAASSVPVPSSAAPVPSSAAAVPSSAAAVPARGGETILMVEDERTNLRLFTQMLTGLGYVVLSAATPAEALRQAAGHQGPIELLITDVVMPGMGGRELSQRIRAVRPQMQVVFISGYTADVIAHDGVLEKGVHFLQKPFSIGSLAQKVRGVLDLRSAPPADAGPVARGPAPGQ